MGSHLRFGSELAQPRLGLSPSCFSDAKEKYVTCKALTAYLFFFFYADAFDCFLPQRHLSTGAWGKSGVTCHRHFFLVIDFP